jgi:hypothetical protein
MVSLTTKDLSTDGSKPGVDLVIPMYHPVDLRHRSQRKHGRCEDGSSKEKLEFTVGFLERKRPALLDLI